MENPVTLDQLTQKTGVPPSLLDSMCTDEDLLLLARFCDPWETIGRRLKLSQKDLNAIKEENASADLRRDEVLRKWKRKMAIFATYRAFLEVLLKDDNALAAYELCKELKKHHPQPTSQSKPKWDS